MNDQTTTLPVKADDKNEQVAPMQTWPSADRFLREIERMFEDFDSGMFPFRRSLLGLAGLPRRTPRHALAPAVDLAETDKGYEITAEMPGMDEKDIEVRLVNGGLALKGERHDEKEEKRKDFYLQERRVGTMERYIQLPPGIDTDHIEATFKKGVLKVLLPKTAEAQNAEKKIHIRAE
ncbi:MAG: Hsp20/alpha crystallin family protein [Bordetella sp.]|uniref:Hsp20/alpha crystallin family protein n=1 Tax=Bordetella sp. TaxID=28081 RepID=UPI003F7BB3D6